MFHNRTWPLSEFAYRTQRYRVYSLNGSPSGPIENVYNGTNSSNMSFAQILNGQTASFTSYQQVLLPSDSSGAFPAVEA